MKPHILVYGDTLSWGIIPLTRRRLEPKQRWPGVMKAALRDQGIAIQLSEDCLNGRRTVWEDPFKPGRNGLQGLAQRIEVHSPLRLVILMLGSNDFQSMHPLNAWHSAQGSATLVNAIREAPIEPGMPTPEILLMAPPAVSQAKGEIAEKFAGAEQKCVGLAKELKAVAQSTSCHFLDAGTITSTSPDDGVHLNANQHQKLGQAAAKAVAPLCQ